MPPKRHSRKCPSGQIRRKSYMRSSYMRGNTRVAASRVPSSCVKDRGKPGRTPSNRRVLPPFSGKIHLRNYGYSTSKNEKERHTALVAAMKDHKPLEILRHLNLARNYQADDPQGRAVAKIMGNDIEFMSKHYGNMKASGSAGRRDMSRSKSYRKTSRTYRKSLSKPSGKSNGRKVSNKSKRSSRKH